MYALANVSIRILAGLLFIGGLLGLGLTSGRASAESADTWYRLEFSAARPSCAVREQTATSRCYGTRGEVALFEMRNGERVVMPDSQPLPPAWAALEGMWVYAPAVAGGYMSRSIELTGTPMGVRLLIEDRDRQYLQSVALNRWVQLGTGSQPKLWVRVTPSDG